MTRRGLRGRRRGSALILVLLMTLAVAALAVAAIFMSSSASLLSRFYDKERQFAYAAQSGIDRVVSRLQLDTTFSITSTTPSSALDITTLATAGDSSLTGVTVRVWAARTGDTTSSGPITISLLAQVADANGTRYVRRVDLRRLHFGQWSMISNTGNASGNPFANSTLVDGRVHSNADWTTITQVSFRDSVTSTGTVGTTNAANLRTGEGENQRRIPWPDDAPLLAQLDTAAKRDTLYFDISSNKPSRVEFLWRDLNGGGVADRNEGFLRIYELETGMDADFIDVIPGSLSSSANAFMNLNDNIDATYGVDDYVIQNQCGAFYLRNGVWQFFPVATHRTWAWAIIDSAAGKPGPPASGNTHTRDGLRNILAQPTARCFPSGSPYLVNTERFTNGGGDQIGTGNAYTRPYGVVNPLHRYGGQDTTITIATQQCGIRADGTRCDNTPFRVGTWRTLSSTSGWTTTKSLGGGRGVVVYFDDDVRVSGTLAGRATLAVAGNARLIDDVQYAAGPNTEEALCDHLFGIVARGFVRISENLINHRTRGGNNNGTAVPFQLGGKRDFTLHGAVFSIDSYFGLEGTTFRHGNGNVTCDGSSVTAGCIRHVGSVAMQTTRQFSGGNGQGGRYLLTPDACFDRGLRPPYYPATNRYRILRSVDVRAAHVISDAARIAYFASLQGTSEIP